MVFVDVKRHVLFTSNLQILLESIRFGPVVNTTCRDLPVGSLGPLTIPLCTRILNAVNPSSCPYDIYNHICEKITVSLLESGEQRYITAINNNNNQRYKLFGRESVNVSHTAVSHTAVLHTAVFDTAVTHCCLTHCSHTAVAHCCLTHCCLTH